jgi:hypothetical protein
MQEHTERERDAWLYWIREHYDEKSITEWYLQSIAVEIRRSYAKKAKFDDLHLPFDKTVKKTVIQDPEIATRIAKARWFGITGYKEG